MTICRPIWLTLCALVLCAGAARADSAPSSAPPPSSTTQLAKEHFALGRAHYERGELDAAIREFELGYKLKPLPTLLFNIAQVARVSGQNAKALDAYERYLKLDPRAPERADVEHWIAVLRKKVDRSALASSRTGARTPAPAPAPTVEPVPAPEPARPAEAAAQALIAPPPPPAPPPKNRRTLWIVLGTVGGALVLGGVVTGIVLGTRGGSDQPSNTTSWGSISLGAH
jgi:tetratricopeptide (TPR) repeat protein